MKVEDLNILGTVSGLYELKQGVVYLVTVDGKHFSPEQAHALLRQAAEDGLNFHIVATLYPNAIKIEEECPPSS